ncbi:MAG: carboxypeptidase-like regulatory domain-containing protein [Pyrinomonadaceae bacterium]
MEPRQFLITILFLLSLGGVGATAVSACQCGNEPSLPTAFAETQNIVVVKVSAVKKSNDRYAINGLKSVTAVVEKSYKGRFKPGDELRFAQGGGANCLWEFNQNSIGDQFLFYLDEANSEDGIWYVTFCGRSSTFAGAAGDLLYLDNLKRFLGRTRLSGQVNFHDDEELRSRGIQIRIRGERKTYEVRTNRHGVYEIYDLPAGNYLVEPEMPRGWTVLWYPVYEDPYELPKPKASPPPPANQVIVQEKGHTEFDFALNANSEINGIVIGPDGKPLENAEVNAIRLGDSEPTHLFPETTKADGEFRISDVGPGRYLLVVNLEGVVDSVHPYPTVYYPDVFDRGRAVPIGIVVGETVRNMIITIPKMKEMVTLSGVVEYVDGQPVTDCLVEFRAEGQARFYRDFLIGDCADEQGRFSFQVIKGSKGTLVATTRAGVEDYADCPALRPRFIRIDDGSVELATDARPLQAEANLGGLVLKFAFPPCEPKKD